MENFIELPKEERAMVIEQTALNLSIPGNHIVEKDFWVSWVLDNLFNHIDIPNNIVFKGGTSLSKAYNLIKRFSEDIDVTIDRHSMGFDEPIDTIKSFGSTKRKKYFSRLSEATGTVIKEIQSQLDQVFRNYIHKEDWRLELSPENPEHIYFYYPQSFSAQKYGDNPYVNSSIILEFGSRGSCAPSQTMEISTLIAKAFPDYFSDNNFQVNVLSAEKTFWEKITLLHMLTHRSSDSLQKYELSRHYYDVAMLYESEIGNSALSNLDMLAEVADYKSVMFKSTWASYETAAPGQLRLIPEGNRLSQLRDDYSAMSEMFYAQAPNFDSILGALFQLEKRINR